MNKPYVVSADVYLLMKRWATIHGFILPPEEFFRQLRENFCEHVRQIFPCLEFIPENELSHGIAALVSGSGLPSISLDRVYFEGNSHLDITRLVNWAGKDCGFGRRAGTLPILRQFRNLRLDGMREVVLVDDVIVTGSLVERVIVLLSSVGIRVRQVVCGVGIAEGIGKLRRAGYTTQCVREYEDVVDEVCERDFYPGVPYSGRQLCGSENMGVPYLLPFGNPAKWASIPESREIEFSRFCIKQTVRMFEEIEKYSGKIVDRPNLGRQVFGLLRDVRFVHALDYAGYDMTLTYRYP